MAYQLRTVRFDRLVIAGGRTPSGSNQCASCGYLQINEDLRDPRAVT